MVKLIRLIFSLLPAAPDARGRILGFLTMAASLFALGFAYTAQYGFDLQPCILCLYQRWPYHIAAGMGLIAFFLATRKNAYAAAPLWVSVVLFLIDSGIAFYQVGVEQKWWHGTEGCSGADLIGLSGSDLLAKIQAAPTVRCDEIQFEFLGLTMAAYNGLFALGLATALTLALTLKNPKSETAQPH